MSGLCISADPPRADRTRRRLVTQVISDKGARTLAETGYVMPANLDVVNCDAFVQTGSVRSTRRVRPRGA